MHNQHTCFQALVLPVVLLLSDYLLHQAPDAANCKVAILFSGDDDRSNFDNHALGIHHNLPQRMRRGQLFSVRKQQQKQQQQHQQEAQGSEKETVILEMGCLWRHQTYSESPLGASLLSCPFCILLVLFPFSNRPRKKKRRLLLLFLSIANQHPSLRLYTSAHTHTRATSIIPLSLFIPLYYAQAIAIETDGWVAAAAALERAYHTHVLAVLVSSAAAAAFLSRKAIGRFFLSCIHFPAANGEASEIFSLLFIYSYACFALRL